MNDVNMERYLELNDSVFGAIYANEMLDLAQEFEKEGRYSMAAKCWERAAHYEPQYVGVENGID